METMICHCEDCGKTVEMEIEESDKNDAEAAIISFNGWLARQGWREVRYGFLGMFRKFVCNICQMKY